MQIKLKFREIEDNTNIILFNERIIRDLKQISQQLKKENFEIIFWEVTEVKKSEKKKGITYSILSYDDGLGGPINIFVSDNGLIQIQFLKLNQKTGELLPDIAKNIRAAIQENDKNFLEYGEYIEKKEEQLYMSVAQHIALEILKKETDKEIEKEIKNQKLPNLSEYMFHFTDYNLDEETNFIEEEISIKFVSSDGNELYYDRLEITILYFLKMFVENKKNATKNN